ncbi:MAG: GAF domain-containing protein [Chloroflexi bacterium]|nr:GAF domain-containing protein [Chloroflexota bacterium]
MNNPDLSAPMPDRAYIERLELVNRLALLVASSLDLRARLKTIAQELRAALHCYAVSIALVSGAELAFHASDTPYGFWDDTFLAQRRHRLDGPSLMARAVRQRRILAVPDVSQDPLHTPSPLLPLIRSEAVVPLIAGGQVVGAITALGDQPAFFSAADVQLLEAAAPYAGTMVRNAQAHEIAQRSLAQLEAIQHTSAEVAGELELPVLLRQLVTRSMQLLGGTSGGIYLWDADAEVLRLESAASPRNIGAQLKPGEGASGVVFQTGQPLMVADYQAWPGRSAIFESSGLRSIISVPLIFRQELIGVMTLSHNEQVGLFTDADAQLLSLFANQAAVAIANARLFREARDKAEQNNKLYVKASQILRQLRFFDEVNHSLKIDGSLDEKLQAVADQIRQAFGYPYVDIALVDDASLSYRASSSDQPGYVLQTFGFRLPLDEQRITTHAVLTRSAYYAPDTSVDPYYRPAYGRFPTASELAVPILLGERVIGALNLERRELRAFDANDIALAEALAVQLAAIIQNAQLFEQLKSEQRQLSNALEQIADGVIAVDCGGRILSLNAKASVLLATDPAAMAGRSCDDFLVVQGGGSLAALVARAAERRQNLSPGEQWLSLRHALPANRTLTVSLAPLAGTPSGEARSVLIALWDVTERAQVDNLRSDIVSSVSHELRTPLTRIRLRVEKVAGSAAGPMHDRDDFHAIIADVTLLEQLIANILQAARIQGGRLVLQRQPVALPPLARQVARETGQAERFALELAADTPLVYADSFRMHEVLTNLVNNAIQYSPPGSPLTIRMGAQADGCALVGISDRGEGIPAVARERIFDRFYRVPRENTRPTYGSGLGLYITRGLVEAHGGRIWVESEEGVGSAFFFTLPAYTLAEGEHDANPGR